MKIPAGSAFVLVHLALALGCEKAPPESLAAPRRDGFVPELDEQQAARFSALEDRPHHRYDPIAYLLPKPSHTLRYTLPEHPEGRFAKVTNNLGFFEDEPTPTEKRGLRVLVSGDSHTAGIVDNRENFCQVAERELQRSLARADIEVLNAGVGYTGPTCYLGVLRKYLYLSPDVFVAVLFVGNDFCDEAFFEYCASRTPKPPLPPGYLETAKRVNELWMGPFAQGLNEVYRWKAFESEVEMGLERALVAYRAMSELCAENGILLLAAILPTKMDVDEDDRAAWEEACRELGLAPEDARRPLEVGLRFRDAVRAAGIRCLDPTEAMRAAEQPLHWRQDYHLGLEGHALFGRLLAQEIEELLALRAR